jgi:hypothetical protein
MGLLELLNQYSTLFLGAVTAVYVGLTWGMVSEMQRTRGADLQPNLIAYLLPLGATAVKLRISNVGPGPALNIEAATALHPPGETLPTGWLHPGMLSREHFDFALPSRQMDLAQLPDPHRELHVGSSWQNITQKNSSATFCFDLAKQRDGWYKSDQLIPPDEPKEIFTAIRKELSGIGKKLDDISRQLK